MRKYGAHSYSGDRHLGRVDVGSSHVTVVLNRSSAPVVALILERTVDPVSGAVTALLLDRLVVPHHTDAVGGWFVRGAYVTELTRAEPALSRS